MNRAPILITEAGKRAGLHSTLGVPRRMRMLVNFLAFQVGWFGCVLSAAAGMPWIGLAVCCAVVGLHLTLSDWRAAELRLLLVSIFLGLLLDSALVLGGWLSYEHGQPVAFLAPYWIVAMWALFATTVNYSMRWLHGRLVLAALAGAIGGPLSFLAGARMGAVNFGEPAWQGVLVLALVWSMAMPLLVLLGMRLELWESGRGRRLLPDWIANP